MEKPGHARQMQDRTGGIDQPSQGWLLALVARSLGLTKEKADTGPSS